MSIYIFENCLKVFNGGVVSANKMGQLVFVIIKFKLILISFHDGGSVQLTTFCLI